MPERKRFFFFNWPLPLIFEKHFFFEKMECFFAEVLSFRVNDSPLENCVDGFVLERWRHFCNLSNNGKRKSESFFSGHKAFLVEKFVHFFPEINCSVCWSLLGPDCHALIQSIANKIKMANDSNFDVIGRATVFKQQIIIKQVCNCLHSLQFIIQRSTTRNGLATRLNLDS